MKRNLYIAAVLIALLVALGIASSVLTKKVVAQAAGASAPRFEVDPFWPKPLPNHWVMGMTIGVSVDAQDHIWIVHRSGSNDPGEQHAATNPPMAECCTPAPPVLEFDQAGNLLRHWGGPGQGYDWPDSNHGITIDYKGNVWIGGNGAGNNQVLKFTQDGKFLMQIGHPKASKGSNDVENLNRPAKTYVDPLTNEL